MGVPAFVIGPTIVPLSVTGRDTGAYRRPGSDEGRRTKEESGAVRRGHGRGVAAGTAERGRRERFRWYRWSHPLRHGGRHAGPASSLGYGVGHADRGVQRRGPGPEALATGTIELSPVEHRRIRYTVEFTADDGSACRFDGWKSIEWAHVPSTWTTLPGTSTVPTAPPWARPRSGSPGGTCRRWWPACASGVARPRAGPDDLAARRWDGRPGRLEVWYDTLTDPATGTGVWLHHELVAPTPVPERPAYSHGWIAVFPPDGPRCGSGSAPARWATDPWFTCGEDVRSEPGRRSGRTASLSWDLTVADGGDAALHLPRRHVAPGAPPGRPDPPAPTATYRGTVTAGGRTLVLDGARGGRPASTATATPNGGGGSMPTSGTATCSRWWPPPPRRRGLDRLRPLPFVRLRLDGPGPAGRRPGPDPVPVPPGPAGLDGVGRWGSAASP